MSKKEKKVLIVLEDICKNYQKKGEQIKILSNLSVKFESGVFYAIMGHSGSGKATLINILGLIDSFDKGNYKLYDKSVKNLNDNELSHLRMKNIGFVFQNFQLDPYLKAYENVMLPMLINKDIAKSDRYDISVSLLKKMGLENRINHYPNELSGGEQQRVALARALANNPAIILADEPTGNLDKSKENEIFLYLKGMANNGKCVIVVSHSDDVKKYADKIYTLEDGKLIGDDAKK